MWVSPARGKTRAIQGSNSAITTEWQDKRRLKFRRKGVYVAYFIIAKQRGQEDRRDTSLAHDMICTGELQAISHLGDILRLGGSMKGIGLKDGKRRFRQS